MKLRFHFKGRAFAKWFLTVIGAGWVLGATWFAFIQLSPMSQVVYEAQNAELAKCRKLLTSDARYQCTSKIMLARDNRVFNKTLIILLPPLGLLIGYWGVAAILGTRRDHRKDRIARDFSHQRMAEWRSHLNDMRATLEAQQKAAKATPLTAHASETQPPRARKR